MAESDSRVSFLERLKEQTQCPVCLGTFIQPKLLLCNHTFCKECIEHLPVALEGGDHLVKCPTCRKSTKLPRHDATNLPPAFHINMLIELHQATNDLLTMRRSSSPANLPSTNTKKCLEHDRPLEMYCDDCREVVCVVCGHHHHRHHNCDFITAIFAQHKQELSNSLKTVTQMMTAIGEALYRLTIQEKDIIQNGDSVKNEIDELLRKLVEVMRQSGEALKEQVNKLMQEKLSKISKQKETVKKMLDGLNSTAHEVQGLLNKGTREEILVEKKRLVERLEATSQEVSLQELKIKEHASIMFQPRQNILEKCSKIGEVSSDTPTNSSRPCSSNIAIVGRLRNMDVRIPNIGWLDRLALSCYLVEEDGGLFLQCRTKHIEKDKYRISFTPTHQGLYHVKVQVKGSDTHCDPCTIQMVTQHRHVGNFTGLRKPETVTFISDDTMIVTEHSNSTTTIISNKGDIIQRFKYKGGVVRTGACLSHDNCIIILTKHAPHITKYSQDHTLVATANSSYGNGPLQFKYPGGVAVNQKGLIHVCDSGNNRIQVLSPNLTLSHMFGVSGKGQLQFNYPCSIAIDAQDTIYVCDNGNSRLQKISSSGAYLGEFSLPSPPLYAAVDGGLVYVTTDDNVMVLDKDGYTIDVLEMMCHGVAARDGNVYLCDTIQNQIIALLLHNKPL